MKAKMVILQKLFVALVLLLQVVGGRAEQPSRRVRGVHQRNNAVRRTESTRRRLMNDDKDVDTPAPTPAPSPLPTERTDDKDDYDDDTPDSTPSPTMSPVEFPTTPAPTGGPTGSPTSAPTSVPTGGPTLLPTTSPSLAPSPAPSSNPSGMPSQLPSLEPSLAPSLTPSLAPSVEPSSGPTSQPSLAPSSSPSIEPSMAPSPQPSAMPSQSPKVDLTDFNILLTKVGGDINVIAVTETLETYLDEGLKAKFSNMEYVSLDLLEGDRAFDSSGKRASALRYVGVASFDGHGTAPDQTTFNAEEGFLLTTSETEVQKRIDANPALAGVVVEEISFESLGACDPFPNDCKGEVVVKDNTTMIFVASLGAMSLCVILCASLILRRHVKARAAMAAETEEAADPASKVVLEDTSVSLRSGELDIKPGCASLVGSAMVELDEKQKAARQLSPPKSPGTPYSAERPQEIQVRNLGDSEDDELDLGYLTMDEDLKSQYFDPTKHAHDAPTLDGTQTLDDGDQSSAGEQSLSP